MALPLFPGAHTIAPRALMPRMLSFAMFFLIATLVVAGLHFYLWSRLVRAPGWPAPWTVVGTLFFVLMTILLLTGMPLMRSLPRAWASPLAWVIFAWMGLGFLLTMTTLATDFARWAGLGWDRFFAARSTLDPQRREVLFRGAAGLATISAVGLAGMGLRNGLGRVGIKEVSIPLPRLPEALSGYTIVQLTDIHVGPTIGKGFIEEIVAQTNALQPDAVVITGDLVDGSVEQLGEHVAPLGGLKARQGVFFVTGNHEYYSGADAWIAFLEGIGIRVLRNERVALGDGEHSFDLAGIDDFQADRFGYDHGPNLSKAVAGRDPTKALVLLAHQPKAIEEAAQKGVGLQISGHTHGGQIWPFSGLVNLVQPYLAGLHRHSADTWIYVSRGTGFWGPPMRLGAPAEISKLVLQADASSPTRDERWVGDQPA